MTDALLVSNVVLWVAVVVLAGVVVALARQIGVLYERVAPAGALLQGHGPVVGDAAPVVTAEDLRGGAVHRRRHPRRRAEHAALLPLAHLPGVQDAAARRCARSRAARVAGSTSCSRATARATSTRRSCAASAWSRSATCCRRRSA